MTPTGPRKLADELNTYLTEVKQTIESVARSPRQLELTPSEVIELMYISQRIDHYLKVVAGKSEPRRNP